MSNHVPDVIPGTYLMDDEAQLYSLTLAAALNSLSEALQHHAGDIENRFFNGLTRLSGSTQILKTLSEPELRRAESGETIEYWTADSLQAYVTGLYEAAGLKGSSKMWPPDVCHPSCYEGGIDRAGAATAWSRRDR